MPKAIFKFPIGTGQIIITVPTGSVPLCVQLQRDKPTIWFEVDPHAPIKEQWQVTGVGAGNIFNAEDVGSYLSTIQYLDGDLVIHFFVKKVA